MANQLKMAIVQAILQLHALGWSQRRVATELQIDRETVARYLKLYQNGAKPAPGAPEPPGSADPNPATFSGPPGSEPGGLPLAEQSESATDSNPASAPLGSDVCGSSPVAVPPAPTERGAVSHCEPFRAIILAKLQQGLTAQRIYQDLATEHAYEGSYYSVKRFVRRLGRQVELPMRRMECAAGEEAQIDFGTGAPLVDLDGKRRKTNVFRVVLSHSRKAYSEATCRQTTEDFIRCLENAFWYFGGVPKILIIDNLRAAVSRPDGFDPELNPKLQSFCQHYGTVILPTKPRMPRPKGKIERGIGYVKGNGLKARPFSSVEAQNQHLLEWEATVADTRIHGTTKQQVGKVFVEVERAALQPLPRERFEFFPEAQRIVSRDGHVEVAKAYYSTPPEYLGRKVWVRWDGRLVRIFNSRLQQVALHVRHEPGRFSTLGKHLPAEKISGIERGSTWLLTKASAIGPRTAEWATAMFQNRGIQGVRVLQGLLSLTKRHPSEALEKACETALAHQAYRLRTLRQLIERQAATQEPLPFLDEHPLIRPLSDYGRIVTAALARSPAAPEGFERHGWAKEYLPGIAQPADKSTAQQKHPGDRAGRQGAADMIPPPRSGYPLPGCSSAEPGSVSPDSSTVVLPPSLSQENPSHE